MTNASTLTVQQILSAAGKGVRVLGLKKPAPPNIESACDPLTLTILKKAEQGGVVTGAEIAGAVLLETSMNCTADVAYANACYLASPLLCRHPLLESQDVALPDKPPSMWEAQFTLTEAGKHVLAGNLPHCLINGYVSRESRMPPIRAQALAEAIQIICSGVGAENLDSKLAESDFACPCVVDDRGGVVWVSTGKGVLTCQNGADLVGNEVHVNMIPNGISQEDAVEKLCELLEDVPGVENCEARVEPHPVSWYKLVAICKNEGAAKSCLEAVLAGVPLKSKFKIVYTISDSENNRTHSTPQEILRCYITGLVSRGEDPLQCAKKLIEMDSGSRSIKKLRGGDEAAGVQAIWVIDSSGRNKVAPLSSVKRQSRGGKGARFSESDIKVMIGGRARQRCVLFGGNGMLTVLNIRAPDTSDTLLHPAETLPEGVSGIVSGLVPEESKFIIVSTSQGMIKKVDRLEMAGGRRGTKVGMKTSGGDSVVGLAGGDEEDDVILVTSLGYATRFKLKQLRSMGMTARGVTGMSVKDGDRVAAVVVPFREGKGGVFLCASDGSGKVLETDEIPMQNRGGVGAKIIEMHEGVKIIGATKWSSESEILLGARSGKLIRFSGADLKATKRDSGNSSLMEIDVEDAVVFAMAMALGDADTQTGDAKIEEPRSQDNSDRADDVSMRDDTSSENGVEADPSENTLP